MSGWRPVPERPGFEVNAAGRVRRASERFEIYRLADGNFISRDNAAQVRVALDPEPDEDGDDGEELRIASITQIPTGWTKGQLLNVRNRGEFYVVTLLGEEDEPPLKPAPSGVLRFTNPALCQDFVSRWYTREHFDPRAF